MKFTGYACVTDHKYDMGPWDEHVAPGAFTKTLRESPDVTFNLNHGEAGSGLPMARTKAGNLKLSEDPTGLFVEADLDPEDPDVQLLARKMSSGNLDGQMSFAFRMVRQSFNQDWTDREIHECNLHRGDVSAVTQAANPATSSSLRALMAPGIGNERGTREQRAALAKAIGDKVRLEFRSFELGGHRYDISAVHTRSRPQLSHSDGPAAARAASVLVGEDALRERIAQLEAEAGQRDWRERLPVFDASAERARLEALRYPQRPAA
jgi:hypothetical protein